MNVTVNPNYKQAIESFSWNEHLNNTSNQFQHSEIDHIVNKVAIEILGVINMMPMLEPLSLTEGCYLFGEYQENRSQRGSVALIQQASENEKLILNHSFKKLENSEKIVGKGIEKTALKAGLLLFGIHDIHNLALKIDSAIPEQANVETTLEEEIISMETKIEKKKTLVNSLIEKAIKYDPNNNNCQYVNLDQSSLNFLATIKQTINEQKCRIQEEIELIKALKMSLLVKKEEDLELAEALKLSLSL